MVADGYGSQSNHLPRVHRHIDSGAKLEAVLYRGGVPDRYLRSLTRKLRGTSREVIGSAMLLFEGLKEDERLTDKDRTRLLPSLVGLVREYGGAVHTDEHVEYLVDNYLKEQREADTSQESHPSLLRARKRERHAGERWIIYGSEGMGVLYGRRAGGYGTRIKRKIPASRVPSWRMVQKVVELVESVNRGNWRQATERYHDLTQMTGHLFYNAQTYKQFLAEIGSVILQKSKIYKFELGEVEVNGFPTSYSIEQPSGIKPKQIKSKKPRHTDESDYVDRHHRIKRPGIVADDIVAAILTLAPQIQSRRPHPILEKVIARTRQ